LDDVVGNVETIERLKVIAKDGNCPHIIISVRENFSISMPSLTETPGLAWHRQNNEHSLSSSPDAG
jgi:hypothetical protein